MVQKRIPLGPTGETVRARVSQLREEQNLSYTELARRCEDVGRSIPVLGLRRIEAGARRVDVDDVMALAAALDVPPATLLMPDTTGKEWDTTVVETTGQPDGVTLEQLWAWLRGARPTDIPALNKRVADLGYRPDDYAMYKRRYVMWVLRAWPSAAPPFTVTEPEDADHGDD
jgi:transcriptional regulator with XRE-family HTH domain